MKNYRVFVNDEYRGLMKAEDVDVAWEVARQWSGGLENIRIEQTGIPSVMSEVDVEIKRLINRGK